MTSASGRPIVIDALGDAVTPGSTDAGEAGLSLLRAILDLRKGRPTPTLLILPDGDDELPGTMETALRSLVAVATTAPRLPIALAVSTPLFETYVRGAADSFASAVIRENVIHIPGWTADQIQARLAPVVGPRATDLAPVANWLAARGACDVTIERLRDAALPEPAENAAEPVVVGRSAQEEFLHSLLEDDAELGGLFRLNGTPGFLFGRGPAEVDLLCDAPKVAIEIDGYYHFCNAECYRRDRRKDWELQRRGYLVLRFLAEDVVPRMQEILETIRNAVQLASRVSDERRRDART